MIYLYTRNAFRNCRFSMFLESKLFGIYFIQVSGLFGTYLTQVQSAGLRVAICYIVYVRNEVNYEV
ncbi:MAG: hypothetical protein EGR71_06535 [Clostridiales bacterium]|nr:hypothetical protein [Clostridiales bacterium]